MRRHRRRLRIAAITGGLGVIMAALASTYLRRLNPATGLNAITLPGLLSVLAAAIMVSLAIVSFITDPEREPRLERRSAWLWRGPAGRLLFRLAAKGIASEPGRRNGNGPTEVTSLATGVAELVDGLDTTQRRKLGRARDQVLQLERRAADLARRDQELERGLVEAGEPLAGDPELLQGRRGDVVRELETALTAAREERALLLERLEAVRLQLVRLRAGVGCVEEVEGELGSSLSAGLPGR
jgi:hypothetical protein